MTKQQEWALEFMRMFETGQLSGELVIRFRDGVPVEAIPSPRYKSPKPGVRAKETRV